MKKQTILIVILVSLFSAFSTAQNAIDKSSFIGIWQEVDSLGNPMPQGGATDIAAYKIYTPETFSFVQSSNSKGVFIGVLLGTFSCENGIYTENICYTSPAIIKTIGNKNRFNIAMKNGLLYIAGINNPYNQIWKKIDKLPAATITPQSNHSY